MIFPFCVSQRIGTAACVSLQPMFSAAVLRRSTLHANSRIGIRVIQLSNYFLEKEKSETRVDGTKRLRCSELIFRYIEMPHDQRKAPDSPKKNLQRTALKVFLGD
ncbi:hypothetical protein A6X21_09615 [Planctopirus hydrillae]|uniref:Uncharacterized protein n=1 Tax=Planctopirus hydrillae TaxID=1841610 RepID=A0A1C3E7I0_9PLAN|nr:hypothetical protein A6X21_09615 [Planctopirus hydrillae]